MQGIRTAGISRQTRAIAASILAAVLYALMTPVSKWMLLRVPPIAQAGFLYLGAGAGMYVIWLVQTIRRKRFATAAAQEGQPVTLPNEQPSVDRSDLRYILMMVVLDMAAPVLLLIGLTTAAPENVSLLNNFEIVATTMIASVFFRERISRRLAVSIGLITLACLLLSFDGAAALSFSSGSLFVLLACLCWGLENNCTNQLSAKDTRQIVIIKGLGSGTASLVLSLVIGEGHVMLRDAALTMLLGFLAIGLSVFFYVRAQSVIGAARTSAYYAVSPFVGVVLALVLFCEIPGMLFWPALLLMLGGVWLSIKENADAS